MHLRGISSETERLAKAAAARRGISLSEFVSHAILQATRAAESEAERRLAPLSAERAWYDEHRDEVVEKYNGKIVAIANGEILVAGDSLVDVAGEVRSKLGDRPVYVVDLTSQRQPRVAPSPARGGV